MNRQDLEEAARGILAPGKEQAGSKGLAEACESVCHANREHTESPALVNNSVGEGTYTWYQY